MEDDEGRDLREVLLSIIADFPSYDLDTEEGCREAGEIIKKKLSPVSSLQETLSRDSLDTLATEIHAEAEEESEEDKNIQGTAIGMT